MPPAVRPEEQRRWGRLKPLRSGVLLRDARETAGLTLGQVCASFKTAVGVKMSASQLSDIERGIAPLALSRARQLAAVYGVDAGPIIEAILQDRLEDAGFTDFRVIVTVSSR